jgi:starvation-inducible DNA-binding protein
MSNDSSPLAASRVAPGSQPWLHQRGEEIQAFGTVREFPVGLSQKTRLYSCQRLNQLLADTQVLFTLYKKHHWLVRGATSISFTCCSISTPGSRWR